MIPLRPRRVDRANNNTPILSNREIDEYAHAVLADYKPRLLREPGIVNYEHFLESYCELRVMHHDIYSDDEEQPILAITAFKDIQIQIFDRESECIRDIVVPARSVVLNNIIAEPPDMKPVARFSGVHEGGHSLMQWHVFTGETIDGEPFDPDYKWDDIYPAVCCRREHIESKTYIKRDKRTAEEWREHHADYFGGAVTMPNATFIPYIRRLLRDNGYYKGFITMGRDDDLDILAHDLLPDAINETYGVSKQAARIKLRTSGFVRGTISLYQGL